MLKHQIILEVKKNERTYQLHLSNDSPLGEVHDILYEMRSYIINRLSENQQQDKRADPPQAENIPCEA